jgi:hypothetical protein
MSARMRRLTLWIAGFAILLAALAPPLAALSGRAPASSAAWHQVCSAVGAITATADDSTPAQSEPTSTQHCLWCKSGTAGDSLPNAVPTFRCEPIQLATHFEAATSRCPESPRYLVAAPRGPPSHS